jgi:iron complex outermembrane receptor protein
MLYLKKYLFFAILFFPFVLSAQENCNLSFTGRILDADTELPVADISIELEKLHITVKSDGHGFFKFENLCPGRYYITVSGIGFERSSFEVQVKKNSPTRDFRIEHEGVVLHDVEIIGHQPTVRSTATTESLNARQLEENSGEVLAQILNEIPGVTMMQTGATISKPVIHGLHSNRVLMVNNGIKQEGQQWGAEHAPEIDPFVASNLTVIKGAESVRYGAEAIGGVILVEPAPLPIHSAFGGSLNLVGNTNGRSSTASALLEGNVKAFPRLSWRAQGTLKRGGNLRTADYYLNNTGVREANYSAALSYRTSGFYVDAYYSHFNTELGIFEGAHIGSLSDLESALANGRPFSDGSFSYDIGVPRQEVAHDLLKLKAHKDLSNGGQLDLQYGFQRNARQEYDIRRGDRSEFAQS